MGEKNGASGFIRTILWTLIIGSFGWTTFAFMTVLSVHSAHCREAEAKQETIKNTMIERDEKMLKEVKDDFKDMIKELSTMNSNISSLTTEIKNIKEKNNVNLKPNG